MSIDDYMCIICAFYSRCQVISLSVSCDQSPRECDNCHTHTALASGVEGAISAAKRDQENGYSDEEDGHGEYISLQKNYVCLSHCRCVRSKEGKSHSKFV